MAESHRESEHCPHTIRVFLTSGITCLQRIAKIETRRHSLTVSSPTWKVSTHRLKTVLEQCRHCWTHAALQAKPLNGWPTGLAWHLIPRGAKPSVGSFCAT